MNSVARTFVQFLRRDAYIFKKRMSPYIINYVIIYPILYSLCFGYFGPLVSWGGGYPERTTVAFIGCIMLLIQILAFVINIELIIDFEQDRFVEYQISILPPYLVLLARILFSTIFCTVVSLPFYPISAVILQGIVDFSRASWPLAFLHILISSFFFSAINVFGLCAIKSSLHMENLWVRFYHPMIMLGGLQIPWIVMGSVSPVFKYLSLINPMLYVSEGLRGALVGGEGFLPFWLCFVMLIASSLLFTFLALHYFKKRLDHI